MVFAVVRRFAVVDLSSSGRSIRWTVGLVHETFLSLMIVTLSRHAKRSAKLTVGDTDGFHAKIALSFDGSFLRSITRRI